MDTPDLRYPVGKFDLPESVSAQELAGFIDHIAETPARMRAALAGLSESQLETPYRPGGWTVRQVAHHVPDSLMRRAAGPSCRTRAACLWSRRSICWNPCTRVGCRCYDRCPLPNGSAAFVTPSWGRSDWNRMPRSTPGTGATTWLISPHCVSAWVGKGGARTPRTLAPHHD